MTDLLERYLIEIKDRQLHADWEGAKYCATVRKAIELNELEDIINQSVHDLLELTKSAEEKEQELAD